MSQFSGETFRIDVAYLRGVRFVVWLFSGFACLSAGAGFIAYSELPRDDVVFELLCVAGGVFFAGLSFYGYRILRHYSEAAVTVDQDGIWPEMSMKELRLVRWDAIDSIRERPRLQRLDLLDLRGEVLLKIEYQLENFDRLRGVVLERMSPTTCTRERLPLVFSKSVLHHFLSIGGVVACGAACWYIGVTTPQFFLPGMLLYWGMVLTTFVMVYEYLSTVSKLVVTRDALEIGYPYHTRKLALADVEAVKIRDLQNGGVWIPEVELFTRDSRKPIRLCRFGTDATYLYRLLMGVTATAGTPSSAS